MQKPTPGGTGTLGRNTVSRVGYGAMQLERFHDDRAGGEALLRRALELGITHYDTAEFYGDGFVNTLLREVVVPEASAVIVTKVGADPDPGAAVRLRPAQKPHELRASVEANLRRLGVDRLAVVNLRRMEVGPGISAEGDQIVDLDDQLAELVALRDEGLVGDIGLSAVGAESLQRALPAGIVCVQNSYNLLSREFEDLLRVCEQNGVAWVPFFPLGSAFDRMPSVTDEPVVQQAAAELGATPSQVGLAWLLQHSPATLLIAGTGSLAHLAENTAAGDLTLPPETIARLDALGSVQAEQSS